MRGIHVEKVTSYRKEIYLISKNAHKYKDTYVPKYNEYFDLIKNNNSEKNKIGINATHFDKSTGNYWLIMNVNRLVDNLYFVQHFPGAAGHFLQTCLAFSDDVLKTTSKQEKLNYITNIYENETKWPDVRIAYPSEELINSNQISFITLHAYYKDFYRYSNTESMLNFYPNAKVISIVNSNLFVIIRQAFMRNMINMPFSELLSLDKNKKTNLIKNILRNNYINSKIDLKRNSLWNSEFDFYKMLDYSNTQIVIRDRDFIWDVESLYFLDSFIESMKKLYDDMNLSGFDPEIIEYCYNLWIKSTDNIVHNT